MTVWTPPKNGPTVVNKIPLRQRSFLACGSLACCCWVLIMYVTSQQEFSNLHLPVYRNVDAELDQNLYVINQPGCRIPSMSTFGPLVTPYLESGTAARCEFRKGTKIRPTIIIDDRTSLSIDLSALQYYQYWTANLTCKYRGFHRKSLESDDKNIDDSIEYSPRWKPLKSSGSTHIVASEANEFVQVTCTNSSTRNKTDVHSDYFAFVPLKKEVEERCAAIERNLTTKRINVMLVGLDALSRLNFRRQMSKSHQYLIEHMNAIEMVGFNKIGDNTFPNLVPLLTGMSESELSKSCLNNSAEKETFDNCSFVWDFFRDNGYRTVFAEDTPDIAAFNYFKRGFRRQPTDYYLRPFYVEAERVIGFNKPGNCILCLGSRLSLSVLLNYAVKHTLTWDERQKFFGFFWSTSYTHDSFNLNPEGDTAVLEFLKRYRRSRVANNTILMLISDHGLRWGSFRETYQGRLEERLPLLMFVVPKWFRNRYPRAVSNLRRNRAMLTTHYDLHDTLLDLAHLERLEDDAIMRKDRISNSSTRSQSLFLPVDANRTCQRAGVPSTYCTCRDKVRHLDREDKRFLDAGKALLEHMNRLIKNRPDCAPLSIDKLVRGSIESSSMGGSLEQEDNSTSHVVVTVRLIPGNGLFEGTLTYHRHTGTYVVVGTVSRINEYGSQSFCVDDAKLKLYCFCRH